MQVLTVAGLAVAVFNRDTGVMAAIASGNPQHLGRELIYVAGHLLCSRPSLPPLQQTANCCEPPCERCEPLWRGSCFQSSHLHHIHTGLPCLPPCAPERGLPWPSPYHEPDSPLRMDLPVWRSCLSLSQSTFHPSLLAERLSWLRPLWRQTLRSQSELKIHAFLKHSP